MCVWPYCSGTYIYGTLFKNFVGTNTALIAEISDGGDLPVWGGTQVIAEVNDSMIIQHSINQFGEIDYDTDEEILLLMV